MQTWNGGRMDGFVSEADEDGDGDGRWSMGYYDETDLPFYYWLARTFTVADRYFSPVMAGTWPNRQFVYTGTGQSRKAVRRNNADRRPSAPERAARTVAGRAGQRHFGVNCAGLWCANARSIYADARTHESRAAPSTGCASMVSLRRLGRSTRDGAHRGRVEKQRPWVEYVARAPTRRIGVGSALGSFAVLRDPLRLVAGAERFTFGACKSPTDG